MGSIFCKYGAPGNEFYEAVQKNPAAAMKWVKKGKPMNLCLCWDNAGMPVIIEAIRHNELKVVTAIAETSSHSNGEDLNMTYDVFKYDNRKRSPLMWIAECDEKEGLDVMVDILVENRANVDLQERNEGVTALHLAIRKGNKLVFDKLLQKQVNVNQKSKQGITAFMEAARLGHREFMQGMSNLEPNLATQDNNGETALHLAAFFGHADVVDFLVEKKANLDIKNAKGETALYLATILGHYCVVFSLVNAKASLDIQNDSGKTALLSAASLGHSNVVALLAENGANLDLQTFGKTALILAAENDDLSSMNILGAKGANLDIQDEDGSTALMVVAEKDEEWYYTLDAVKYLVGKGANLDLQARAGESALIRAAWRKNPKMVKVLADAGANLDLQDVSGRSALMTAVKWATAWNVAKQIDIITTLTEKGANLDLQSIEGESALSFAVHHENEDFVTMLVDKGATMLNFKDAEDGCKALEVAVEQNRWKTVELLAEKGTLAKGGDVFWSGQYERVCDVLKSVLSTIFKTLDNEPMADAIKAVAAFQDKIDLDQDCFLDESGRTVLMRAILATNRYKYGSIMKAITLLVNKGTNLDLQDKDGFTALMHVTTCAWSPEFLTISNLLLDKGAQVVLKGESMLHLCASHCNPELFNILMARGGAADFSSTDKYGYNSFMRAAQHVATDDDRWSMVKVLADKILDVNTQADDGCNALMLACSPQAVRYWRYIGTPTGSDTVLKFREKPDISSKLVEPEKVLQPGAVFAVAEERIGADKVLYLWVPEFGGWVFDRRGTDNWVLCVLNKKGADIDAGLVGTWTMRGQTYLIQGSSMFHKDDAVKDLRDITSTSFKINGEHVELGEDGKNFTRPHDGVVWERRSHSDLDGCWLDNRMNRFFIRTSFLTLANGEMCFASTYSDTTFEYEAKKRQKTIVGWQDATVKYCGQLGEDGKLNWLEKNWLEKGDVWTKDMSLQEKMQKVLEFATILMGKGADLNLQDKDGKSALMRAALHRYVDIVTFLADNSANVDLQDKNGQTALIYAAASHDLDLATALVDHSANLDVQDNDGWTPLIHAVAARSAADPVVIEMLIAKGAKMDLLTVKKESALWLAERADNKKALAALLDNGFSLDGDTVLIGAVKHRHLANLQMLIEKGADLNIKNDEGHTALITAVFPVADDKKEKKTQMDIFNILVEKGADLDEQDADGCTALIHTASKDRVDMLTILIDKGANLDLQSNSGKTALIFSATLPKMDMMTALVAKGANLDLQDKHGNSAIMHAVRQKLLAQVNLLQSKGANLDLQDTDGVSAHELVDRFMRDVADKAGLDVCDEIDDPKWTNPAIPSNWTNHLAPVTRKFDQMVYVGSEVASKFNEVLKDSYQEIVTRDRHCPKPPPNTCKSTGGGCPCVQPGGNFFPTGYAVRRIIRIEDAVLWQRYSAKRAAIKAKREGEHFHKFDPPLMTEPFATGHADEVGSLDKEINECFLYHGTHIRAALSIAQSNFALKRAGSNVGTMYGKGVYLAESCTKADEYAKNEADGYYSDVFAMILSRVCMGKMYYTTRRDPEAGKNTDDGSHDSTCGDRSKSAHTFREFVVYNQDQVYPQYIIIYSRLHKGDDPRALAAFPYQLQVPIYWKNCHMDPDQKSFDAFYPVRSSAKQLFKKLLSKCSKQRLIVVELLRYEDSKMWNDYLVQKQKLKDELGDIDKVNTQVFDSLREIHAEENDISTENLNLQINELLLWHGTSKDAALSISADGFRLGKTSHGRRFGDGIYLAEDLDKSLSYAPELHSIQYVLLCRAACGDMFKTGRTTHNDAHEDAAAQKKQSILASPGGAREFITLTTQQVYPEFLLHIGHA